MKSCYCARLAGIKPLLVCYVWPLDYELLRRLHYVVPCLPIAPVCVGRAQRYSIKIAMYDLMTSYASAEPEKMMAVCDEAFIRIF